MGTHTHTHTGLLSHICTVTASVRASTLCECELLDSCDSGAEKQKVLCWSKSHKGSFY